MTISHEDYDNLIAAIAYETRQRYPEARLEDLRQEIRVNFYDPKFQAELHEGQAEGAGESYVRRMAYRVATTFGKRERAHFAGYEPCDNTGYFPNVVKELLPDLFAWREDGTLPQVERGSGRSTQPANERGFRQAMMCDLSAAYDRLDAESALLLAEVYCPDPWVSGGYPAPSEVFAALAAVQGIQADSVRMRHDRVVKALCRSMNGLIDQRSGGPGSRKAMSNLRAQVVTRDLTG